MDLILEALRGKTIYRILFNRQVKEKCRGLKGTVVDLAGGGNTSYYKYLPDTTKIIKSNLVKGEGIDIIVDISKKLPFEDGSVDALLLFNAIYTIENREYFFAEAYRTLKSGGALYLSSPFIANEMPEPHDYCRLTYEGLKKSLVTTGFRDISIQRFGERFSSACYILNPFFLFSFVRAFTYPMAVLFDRLIPKSVQRKYPVPLGYFCVAKK